MTPNRNHPPGSDSASGPVPATLRWAVRLLAAEAAGVALLGLYLVYEDLTGEATDLASALAVTVFAFAGAAALFAVARTLSRRRAGARGLAIMLQLMVMVLGYYMIVGGLGWLGGLLIALGAMVIVLLVSPPTTRALGLG